MTSKGNLAVMRLQERIRDGGATVLETHGGQVMAGSPRLSDAILKLDPSNVPSFTKSFFLTANF